VKKIIINVLGINYNISEAKIIIYDQNNCIVYKGCTRCGKLSICLKEKCVYKIKICYCGEVICKKFIISPYLCNYYFNFGCLCISNNNPSNNITFNLRDYYYNLPIEKGILKLNG
jgi:hypothetical protein